MAIDNYFFQPILASAENSLHFIVVSIIIISIQSQCPPPPIISVICSSTESVYVDRDGLTFCGRSSFDEFLRFGAGSKPG